MQAVPSNPTTVPEMKKGKNKKPQDKGPVPVLASVEAPKVESDEEFTSTSSIVVEPPFESQPEAAAKSETIESFDEQEAVEPEFAAKFLATIELGEKPWFLCSSEVYKVVKKSVASIPHGEAVFEKSLSAISQLTKYVNESTKLNVAIDVDQSHKLINELDEILAEQLVVVDDGLDKFRGQLSVKLRKLMKAIIDNKNWAEETAINAKESATTTAKTRYEQVLTFMQTFISSVKTRFPGVYAKVVDCVNQTANECVSIAKETAYDTYNSSLNLAKTSIDASKAKVNSFVMDTIGFFLKKAQPLVVDAVHRSQPFVYQALNVSQPYVEKAKPFVDPIVDRALSVNDQLLHHQYVGPYVSKAYEVAHKVIDETKQYCQFEESS